MKLTDIDLPSFCTVTSFTSTEWASLTFSGLRLTLDLTFDSVEHLAVMAETMENIQVRDHLVVDARLDNVRADITLDHATATLSLLTLKD